jgi:2-polyprenyl-3-methyl-5-hydroxy-6-metoxy-1,4-benzoquinol methylase
MHRPNEKEFKVENYEEFYEHHDFTPIPEEFCINLQRFIPRAGWAVDVAKELKPKRILDLGCLDGSLILSLFNNVSSVERGIGVDLSQEGVDLGTQRASLHGFPAEFVRQDIESWMESCDEQFDMITCFEVMEHVKDPGLVIKLIDKVLAPGGTVLISTPDFEAPTYGKDDEINKCHIRLYTLADEDYEGTNKFGTVRKATSLSKQLKGYNIVDMGTYSELINCRYERA